MTERDFASARRLELSLIWLRWLVVIFGVVQSAVAVREATGNPEFVLPLAIALSAGLAVGNLVITGATLRATQTRQLRTVGVAAFALDTVVILGLLWASTVRASDPVWVIGYIAPLEGAARFGLPGAIAGAVVFGGSEWLREAYLPGRFPGYHFDGPALGYRTGMALAVGVVTGSFARSLRRETERASERAAVAEALARSEADARARLQELDDMKSDFIAITSHELRTPLAAIRGFVDTLRRRRSYLTEAEIEEFLAIIQLQTGRLTRLVEDLLVVSRLEAGRLTFQPEPTELSPFLSSIVRSLGDGAGRIDVREEPALPEEIVVDPQRLGQVLTNLLTNALKYSPPDRRVVLEAGPAGSDRVTFAVTDRGIGVPPEELERIFDRFHQAEPVGTRSAEGVGLGLYITKQLTQAMGGTVSVASDLGRGSTFRVTIPRVKEDLSELAQRSAAARSD